MRISLLKYTLFLVALLQLMDPSNAQLKPIQFSFSNDACHNGTFSNGGSDDVNSTLVIHRNEQTTTCSPGMGVEPGDALADISNTQNTTDVADYHLQSSQPLVHILQQSSNNTNGNAVTISLWVQVMDPDVHIATGPLLTIGQEVANNSNKNEYYPTTECDLREVDFALSIVNGNFVELLYRTNDPYFEPCVRMRVNELPLVPGLNHIAVVLGDRHQQVFVNGQPSTSRNDPFDSKLHHWNNQSMLYLFSFPGYDNYPAWMGQLLQLAIGTDLWNAKDLVAEMAMGLPDAQPIAKSMVHQMKEDAQVIADEASTSANNSTAFLQVPVEYLNHDVMALLEPFNVTDQELLRLQDLKYYIVQYPSRGTLYQEVDGQVEKIEMVQDAPTAIHGPNLYYRPPHNEHSEMPGSVYDSFQYCVSKHAIFAPSQCYAKGTIDIVVDAVNDPPTALINSEQPYLVHEGIYEEAKGLWLGGHDVDRNDGISQIQITKPPQHGFLYLSVPTPRNDGLLHGMRLADVNYTLAGPDMFVEYQYTGSDQTLQSTMAHDNFWFRVKDRNGAWSQEQQAEIRILPSLSIGLPTELNAIESEPLMFQIKGQDESGLDRPIGYFFEALTHESHGTLLDDQSKPIPTNQVIVPISTTESSGLNMTFRSSRNACSDPMVSSVNATFSYRVVALSPSNTVASVSSLLEHKILVKCSMEPLRLHVDEQLYNTKTFSGPPDDPCSGYSFNATITSPASCTSAVIISSIKVEASNRQDERVWVSMVASEGFLTLDRNQRSRISAIGGPVEMRQTIQFVALPSDLQEILSNLHYQTETPGRHKISIKVQSCPGHNPLEITESLDCHLSTASISIFAVHPMIKAPKRLYTNFPWFSLSFTLTMLFLFKSKGKMRETMEEWKNNPADGTYQWKEHYDASTGYYYYENVETGQVTWRAPLHESILPSLERFPDGSNPIPVYPSSTGEDDGSVVSDDGSFRSASLTEACDSDDEYTLDDVSIHSLSSIA